MGKAATLPISGQLPIYQQTLLTYWNQWLVVAFLVRLFLIALEDNFHGSDLE